MSKQEKMFRLVDEYSNSGPTIKRFCEPNDIKVPTFNYWKRKKDTVSSPRGFIKVHSELSTGC